MASRNCCAVQVSVGERVTLACTTLAGYRVQSAPDCAAVLGAACLQFNEDEDVQGTKEQVVHYREVASPDVGCMVLEESTPCLTGLMLTLGHVALNCALAPATAAGRGDPDTELE